ncbi:hypothetical protein PUNSTDRAFT_106716 [Punctularia strigosozonata HHB-11173 SS5]|uniref:uncharacterized protein n=1 Tax=Punctularia strigosozonata (strain HHB-11173) TaxID=741275 RepID=UPI00044177EE|nr:uncharacterized protein PUNSTDRAFT_106716 [Punctularia strigosozonata HHB-11173 SS5]EIN05733.1 hypothetical protein PUNSTDRAFT_106716 [Punctularia strigosozonata HHB-11173 SS5]
MELKLVYRALRKISDWALDGFYSEVYVDGAENVPERAPLIMRVDLDLILAVTRPYERDAPGPAATIPFRRHVSFWAKSSMFRNPLAGQILYSSGAIPVYRNPNSSPIQATSASSSKNTRQPTSLFDTSSRALKRGEVLGVFPEGTSYTEPQIVQIKDGAAWAAVEYAKYVHARQPGSACGLVIVPVGIVYTDKSQYQSRVRVRYGRPIAIDAYASEFLGVGEDDADARARATVRKLTNAIETSLFELTINAPDWDILYASRMARDILWRDPERINLKYWVPVNQRLIGIMDKTSGRERCQPALLRYYSLLHYTGLAHADLSAVLSSRAGESYRPSVGRALAKFVANFLRMTLHPGAILFAPMLVLHVPAYLLGLAAARMFAPPGEEEAPAQWKTVFGGLGMALVYVPASLWTATAFLRTLRSGINSSFFKGFMSIFCNSARVEEAAYRMASFVYGTGGFSVKARLHEAVGWLGVAYVHGLVLARWHNALVGGELRILLTLMLSVC